MYEENYNEYIKSVLGYPNYQVNDFEDRNAACMAPSYCQPQMPQMTQLPYMQSQQQMPYMRATNATNNADVYANARIYTI